jgi:hypothetical protein
MFLFPVYHVHKVNLYNHLLNFTCEIGAQDFFKIFNSYFRLNLLHILDTKRFRTKSLAYLLHTQKATCQTRFSLCGCNSQFSWKGVGCLVSLTIRSNGLQRALCKFYAEIRGKLEINSFRIANTTM